jgi:molybdenum cofactor cytidylyltransferase
MPTPILILAAGSSSRMGTSKQMLDIRGEKLLSHAVKTGLSVSEHVTVVLGSHTEEHAKLLEKLPIHIVENKDWAKGMGNSLKAGFAAVLNRMPDAADVIMMVCDQPALTTMHLQNIIFRSNQTVKTIVASRYSGTMGVPALFKRAQFESLQKIDDQHGARTIIQRVPHSVEAVDFAGGEFDLDTPDDYERFLSGAT